MVQRYRILSAVAAAAMGLALFPGDGLAQFNPNLPNGASGRVHYDHPRDRGGRDRWDRHHRRHHGHWRDRDRRDRNTSGVVLERRDGPATNTSGTYTGNLSSYRDRGNGNYFYVERDGAFAGRETGGMRREPAGPKVINPGSGGSACSDEGGVCVIRPQ